MADKFRVGQKVRIVKADEYLNLLGTICTIVELRKNRLGTDGKYYFSYVLDIRLPTGVVLAEEINLEPLYDGDEASSWSECAWMPKEVKV